jgi:hypothetical protein
VYQLKQNKGLAYAFQFGIDEALKLGATVIVNLDADGQYPVIKIPKLIEPIINKECDVVIGDRKVREVLEFSIWKKFLQLLGTYVVNRFTGLKVLDATSGFRSYNAEAAAWLNISTNFTYTLESLVQLSIGKYKIKSIYCSRNIVTRKSRLFKNNFQYILRNGSTLVRVWTLYKPKILFTTLSMSYLFVSLILSIPFIISKVNNNNAQHIQLVVFSGVFVIVGYVTYLIGMILDSQKNSRIMTQKIIQRNKLLDRRT